MKQVLWFATTLVIALTTLAPPASAGWRHRSNCNGCSDPCASVSCGSYVSQNGYSGGGYSNGSSGGYSSSQQATPRCTLANGTSVTIQQVVLVPSYVTETRTVCETEYRTEERQRTYTIYSTVPVEEEKVRTFTNMISKLETKTLEYTVPVSVVEEKSHEYTVTVPVYEDVEEKYTVKVPVLTDVTENYTVKVPQLKDVPFTYTANVPYSQKETRMKTVTSVVPVTKTRTATYCVPVTRTNTVSKDNGHWETQLVDGSSNYGGKSGYGSNSPVQYSPVQNGGGYAGYSSCGGCGNGNTGYGNGYGQAASYRRVWVPNIVSEEVTTIENTQQTREIKYTSYEQRTEQVPYECVFICYKPETQTGTRQVVEYVDETRTRTRKAVEYRDEERSRTKKVLTFRDETRTETYPVVSYRQETRTKDVSYTVQIPETKTESYKTTRYDRVPEIKVETYTARVPVPVIREVQVQVSRMVPKVVDVTLGCGNERGYSNGYGNGYQGQVQAAYGGYSNGCSTCGQ